MAAQIAASASENRYSAKFFMHHFFCLADDRFKFRIQLSKMQRLLFREREHAGGKIAETIRQIGIVPLLHFLFGKIAVVAVGNFAKQKISQAVVAIASGEIERIDRVAKRL